MQVNKPLSAKQKKIMKRQRAKLKRKSEKLNNFSFQQEMVDIISISNDQHIEQVVEIIQNKEQIKIIEKRQQIWENLPKCVENNDCLLLIGAKNTGKSTLANYLSSISDNCVILDCDIGRNSCLQGCVSLASKTLIKKIWIGQFTPLNNLQTYLRSITYLYNYYRDNLFTKKLVINTMGYLTGLGQFLLYEIFHIIKPKSILALHNKGDINSLKFIAHNIKSGSYISRLHMSRSFQQPSSSTNIFYYENLYTQNKKASARFQKMFQEQSYKVSNIVQLIQLIMKSHNPFNKNLYLKNCSKDKINIYEQSRHGKQQLEGQQIVSYRKIDDNESVDMRIIILGKMIDQSSTTNLFLVEGLGFGFQGKIYSKISMENLIGIVNQGIDFQKGFYHLNQKQLIDLEMRFGRINFIMVATKGLGSKGTRNNPSKVS